LISLRSTALLAGVCLLAACHGSSQKNDQRSASGQVLQGTISDAMLPVDKLKSQGPTLAPSGGKGGSEGAADAASGTADATSESSDTPSDQASPSPSPSPSAAP
jgi:hypothetical protein